MCFPAPSSYSCSTLLHIGESKLYFFVYFAEGESYYKTNTIVNLLNAMPDNVVLVVYPILRTKCHISFEKPQFDEVHEKRVNKTARRFTLPINELIAVVSFHVSIISSNL